MPVDEIDSHLVYLMLHGSASDGTFFCGELDIDDDTQIPAMNLRSLPSRCLGSVVFAGCCWGALTLDRTALQSELAGTPKMRTGADSLALAFLQRGARAFIGCTGTHYSPLVAPFDFAGGPMHSAFWQSIRQPGMPPALALHEARISYLNGIPHGQAELSAQAVEHKTFHQFMCLGLGW